MGEFLQERLHVASIKFSVSTNRNYLKTLDIQ